MAENQRYIALDVFRGMTVCFMIIVNSPGDWGNVYGPLLHAPWHGFTPTDLVFPSFLFAVGNAMAFSMHKYQTQGDAVFWRKTLKRFFIIFLLGFLLSWFPFINFSDGSLKPLGETRILGVLQRIALCYLIASIVIHYGSRKFAIWFSAFVLVGYWLILYTFGDPNDPYSLAGYAGNQLDFLILGENHLYRGEGVPFDPEGILSTLPSIVNVIAGYLAGYYIKQNGSYYEGLAKLLMAGCVLILIALTWHLGFPINKKIWTSSFVLLTVGIDLVLLSLLIYLIEFRKKQKWTYFFLVFGRNPLFIYVLSGVLSSLFYLVPIGNSDIHTFFHRDVFLSIASPLNASLMYALFFMMIHWLVGYVLDKKKIYIKV